VEENQKLLEILYCSKEFKEITNNLCVKIGTHYSQDLHSEIILKIIENGDDLTEIKSLKYYFFAWGYRVVKGYTMSKKYGYNLNRLDVPKEIVPESINEDEYNAIFDYVDKALEPCENDSWSDDYKKKLFKMYLKVGNYRDLAKVTNIPLRSISTTLKEFKEELKIKVAQ
jgi:DNA-directed RNA polymerase specialized sigma24 family protein